MRIKARTQPGQILDLFAGGGGWDEGLRVLGMRALGVEADRWACETARAAGHERLQADVAQLDPLDFAGVWGLIASPPCQVYSAAGNGLGRVDRAPVVACAEELAAGIDTRAERLRECRDQRSLLTLEPLRYAVALRPRWIALEQVPAVLELWSLFAELLLAHGYHTAAGTLSAECYGVAQVRKRAFLIASLEGPVELPAATHRSYVPRRKETPPDEETLEPWVSMAEALGWLAAKRVGPECLPGTPSKRRAEGEIERNRRRDQRAACRHSRPLTVRTRPRTCKPSGGPRRGAERVAESFDPTAAPSPAITTPVNSCQGNGVAARSRPTPAWAGERPATTVSCDRRIHPPGHKQNASDPPCRYEQRRGANAVRLTVEQAAILQGFPADYPWQGAKTRQFAQVGNAVPPPLAHRVLEQALAPGLRKRGTAS